MTGIFLSAVALALGVVIVHRSLRRPTLESQLSRFVEAGANPTARTRSWTDRLLSSDERDLAVTGTNSSRYASEQVICAALAFSTPIAMYVVLGIGGVNFPIPMVVLLSATFGVLGLQIPRLTLTQKARRARVNFRSSLSSYLDLVSIMLSGGAGIETALVAAARVGDGPTYRVITDSLDVARSTGRSPWEVLAEEGRRIGVDELPELAATVKLGGEQGARMTSSLVAKAASLRQKHMAEVEAAANSSTERMGLPMVLMFVAFLVLLGYPAMHLISKGFG
ncbi:MAG: type II secretion system F family protein [Actinomycetota bacterium]|nr:type II secretion system F family protein [Actinomycetota bacterium]MDA3012648.1 type II secretion system F family protein [Actinomycetota bacterium]MDA3024586.1 type II secretion system F family protein [Actinomycetota bacterium]